MKKREFFKTVVAGAALLYANPLSALDLNFESNSEKNVLMLGGRGFLGPSIVNRFLKAGFQVTLLNRGVTNPELFKELPVIICNRELEDKRGIKAVSSQIRNKHWDVVVDTWQKSPKAVQDFVEEFKDNIGHYHYISTISVYDKWDKKYTEETEPLNSLPAFPTSIEKEFRYAIRKTFSEEAIRATTDKFTFYRSSGMKDFRVTRPEDPDAQPYWPVRFYRGGEILLPKVPNHQMQYTDVQSLVNFILHCSETETYGAFNVASNTMPFKDYVSGLIHATQTPKKLHWINGEFLKKEGLLPYKVVPFWRERPVGAYNFNIQKALNAGLVNRPIVDTVSDQIAGYLQRYPNDSVRFGKPFEDRMIKYFSMEKEKAVINKWIQTKH